MVELLISVIFIIIKLQSFFEIYFKKNILVVFVNIYKIIMVRILNMVNECKVYFLDYFIIDIKLYVVMKFNMEIVYLKLYR